MAQCYRIKGEVNDKGEKITPDTFNTKADGSGTTVTAQSIGFGKYVAVKEVESGKMLMTDAEILEAKRQQLAWIVNDNMVKDAKGKDKLRHGRLRKSLYGISQLAKSFKGAKSKRGKAWTEEQAKAIIAMHRQQLDELESILLNTTDDAKTESIISM